MRICGVKINLHFLSVEQCKITFHKNCRFGNPAYISANTNVGGYIISLLLSNDKTELMNSLKLAEYTFLGSLIISLILALSFLIYNRIKKQKDFKVIESDTEIMVIKTQANIIFTSAFWFIYCTIFSIFIAFIKEFDTAIIVLIVIYICSTVTGICCYFYGVKYSLTIDLLKKSLHFKGNAYSLGKIAFAIKGNKINPMVYSNTYGLYIKINKKKEKLIYGFSDLAQIKELKCKLEEKNNR
jgi:hypothetical protein